MYRSMINIMIKAINWVKLLFKNEFDKYETINIVQIIDMILSNEYSLIADVNEDGYVDILDVIIMVNILVGGLP